MKMGKITLSLILIAGCNSSTVDESEEMTSPYDDRIIQESLSLPLEAYSYVNPLPSHIPEEVSQLRNNTPPSNLTSDPGATLGRVLFYDVDLSLNRTTSCASCHHQEFGFTDPKMFSEGFDGGTTARNSMSLINIAFYEPKKMFWDERAQTLEHQVLLPIQDDIEMGLSLEELVARVSAKPYYPILFRLAFDDERISANRISAALAQFVRSIVSFNSPYDTGLARTGNVMEDFPNFTEQENEGKRLFFAPLNAPGGSGGCAVCHAPSPPGRLSQAVFFFMDAPRNNGLSLDSSADEGVGAVTGASSDQGLFKSSSLRNVALTAPYMHAGHLDTLRAVIEHYNSRVASHPNLDPRLRQGGPTGSPRQLHLTSDQMDALVAFLETLTDDALPQDPRFTSPFR